MWFELKGDSRATQRCATEGCGGQATWRMEAHGIGAEYCSGCKAEIDRPAEDIVREMRDEWRS